MKKEYLDKHYRLSKDLIEKIKKEKHEYFKCEVDCVEFYLEKGLMYDKGINEINNRIDKLTKDMTYIKKLLEQLFSNISFSENIDTQNNKLLKEFKNSFLKDKYFD